MAVPSQIQEKLVHVIQLTLQGRVSERIVEKVVDMPVVVQHQASMAETMDGILTAPAQDKSTGPSYQITITNEKGRVLQAQTDRAVQEAKRCRDEDEAEKAKIDAKNGLVNCCSASRNTHTEAKPKGIV